MRDFQRRKLVVLLLSAGLLIMLSAVTAYFAYFSRRNTPPPAREAVKASVYYNRDQFFVIAVNNNDYDWDIAVFDPCPYEDVGKNYEGKDKTMLPLPPKTCNESPGESPRTVHAEIVKAHEAILIPWFKFMNETIEERIITRLQRGYPENFDFEKILSEVTERMLGPVVFPYPFRNYELLPLVHRMRVGVSGSNYPPPLDALILRAEGKEFDIASPSSGVQELIRVIIRGTLGKELFFRNKSFLKSFVEPPYARIQSFTQRLEQLKDTEKEK